MDFPSVRNLSNNASLPYQLPSEAPIDGDAETKEGAQRGTTRGNPKDARGEQAKSSPYVVLFNLNKERISGYP